MRGHDPDLAFARRDDARRVGPDDRRGSPGQIPLHAHHVLDRDAVGDDHGDLDAALDRLVERVDRDLRRHEYAAHARAGLPDRLLDRVEDGKPQVRRAALAGRDATDHLRTAGHRLLGVERRVLASEALDDDLRILADEHAHTATSCAAATALAAASSRSSAWISSRPLVSRIFRPSWTFVPAKRTITGTPISWSRVAWTTPCAIQSHRLIPAKMFTRIAFTFGSFITIRKAFATFSGLAPPPTSRKFAGRPP